MYFVIHTDDKAIKARVGKHIVYNVDWLKEHFEQEQKIYGKKGHWITHYYEAFPAESTIECSNCHREQPVGIDNNYCPACGSYNGG